jgi:hypothetical protein
MWWLAAVTLLIGQIGSTAVTREAVEKAPPLVERHLAQSMGFHCATSVGVCSIPPAPLGAQCFCGNVPGTVVQ